MSNFASIFQHFKNPNTSQLSDLLQQASTTLQKLLDEDCFLSQYRSNNTQLIDYLTYDKYKQLTEFVTLVGPDNQRNRSYKYPFLAVDILSFGSDKCMEYFLPKEPLFVNENVYEEVQVQVQEDSSLCSETSFRSSFGQHEKAGFFQADQNSKLGQNDAQKQEKVELGQISQSNQAMKHKQIEQTQNSQRQTKFNNLGLGLSQISPDDFPDAYQRKIVKKKEVIKKTIKKQVIPLIQLLFDYFYQQVNYILAAYVSRILSSFIEKRPEQFFKQFFTYQSHSTKKPSPIYIQILQHIQSKSVSELVVKLLTYDLQQQNKKQAYFTNKEEMVWIMVNAISIDSNLDAISETGATLVDLLVKIGNNPITVTRGNTNTDVKMQTLSQNIKKTLLRIFDIDFLKKVVQITFGELQRNSAVSGSILLAYFKNISPPSRDRAQQLIQYEKQVNQVIIEGLAKVADQKLHEKFIEKGNKNRMVKFTTDKLRILQCISYLFTSNILSCSETIPSQNASFCLQLTQTFEKYPMNNLVHNQILKVIISILQLVQNQKQINNAIINLLDLKCLYKVLKQALKNRSKIGYFGHCAKIANKLQQMHTGNLTLSQLLSSDRWQQLLLAYLQINNNVNGTSLGGFKSRKGYCCQVMFQKEDILSKFDTFLKGQKLKQLNMDDFDFPQKSQSSSSKGENQNQDFEEFELLITQNDHKKYLYQDQQKQKMTVQQINNLNRRLYQQESVAPKAFQSHDSSLDAKKSQKENKNAQNNNALKEIKGNSQVKADNNGALKSVFADKDDKDQTRNTNENTKVE